MNRKWPVSLRALVLAVALLPAWSGCRRQQAPPSVTIAGKTWQVELAATAKERYRGLAGRRSLSENAGVLFIFPEPEVLTFCMRGCLIPLDIAFISADHRVAAVHTMSVEPDLAGRESYCSGVPVQYALEVPAGALARAAVEAGQRVVFGGNIPQAAKEPPDP